MNLYGAAGGQKYLNAAERRRFIKAAKRAEPGTRLFCLVLGVKRINLKARIVSPPKRSVHRSSARPVPA
jgi:hypothetical protein